MTSIVTKKEIDGTVNSDFSFNKKPEVPLIYNLKVLTWYFKKELAYSDRFAEMQLKPNTVGLKDEIFPKHLCI